MPATPHEAMLYGPADPQGSVECRLCHHRCRLRPGQLGVCRARRNDNGRLVSLVYGRMMAMNADPIEKKPLFHFLPATLSMSVATAGCNFRCEFCQNHSLSQALQYATGDVPGRWTPPEEVVAAALRANCRSLAFTYSEPTIFFEYARDIARLGAEKGLASCFVSNGFMTPEAVETIAPWLDAINVDLKCFRAETYRKVIGGKLDGVLETLRALHDAGIWIEITTLVIPGMNDSDDELGDIAAFISELDPRIPWHVSRFHPDYHMMDGSVTPASRIERALELGRAHGLRHLYCGNLRDERNESTWCAGCGALLIERAGFHVVLNHLGDDGKCPKCGTVCAGVWAQPASRAPGDTQG